MKSAFLFCSAVILLSITAFSLRDNPNQIIVKSTLSPNEAFNVVGKQLLKSGYTLEASNMEFGMITTAPYSFQYDIGGSLTGELKMLIEISKPDSLTVITISGKVFGREYFERAGVRGATFDTHAVQVENRGGKNSIFMKGWNLMTDLAKSIPDSKAYVKRNPELE